MYSYDDGGLFAALMGMMFGIIIFGIIFYVISAYFLMKIFEKAGVQDSWRAWVPIYNVMIFFKLGDLSPWLVLYALGGSIILSWIFIGTLFSIALAVLAAMAAYRVGLKLQKEPVWVVLYIFLGVVWLGILAFDSSRWNNNVPRAGWAGNSLLEDRTVWDGVPGGGHGQAGPPPGGGYTPPPPPPPVNPAPPTAPPTA